MKDTIYREDALFCLTADITNISLEDYIAMIDKRIRELPSAEPKTGEWVEGRDKRFVKCSKCGMETTKNSLKGIVLFGKNEPNFCPCCGSYNGGMT